MKAHLIEAELESIKQEFTYRTEELLRITNEFRINDIKNPEALNSLRKAQIAHNDAFIKLVKFIDERYQMNNK